MLSQTFPELIRYRCPGDGTGTHDVSIAVAVDYAYDFQLVPACELHEQVMQEIGRASLEKMPTMPQPTRTDQL